MAGELVFIPPVQKTAMRLSTEPSSPAVQNVAVCVHSSCASFETYPTTGAEG